VSISFIVTLYIKYVVSSYNYSLALHHIPTYISKHFPDNLIVASSSFSSTSSSTTSSSSSTSYSSSTSSTTTSSSSTGSAGNPAYRSSAFEAVCTFNPFFSSPFISRGAPRQTAEETSVSEWRKYGREMDGQT
jgi:flagellar hook-length control protein FliK